MARANANVVDVSPRNCCWVCISLLAALLIFQLAALLAVLSRIAEIQLEDGTLPKGKLQNAAGLPRLEVMRRAFGNLRQTNVKSTPHKSSHTGGAGKQLAISVSVGMTADASLIYLSSLMASNPTCDVVLLGDQPIEETLLRAEELNLTRIHFEKISEQFPAPFQKHPIADSRYYAINEYLRRPEVIDKYDYIQVSDVDDIAFQGDPFAWVSSQSEGLHAFGSGFAMLLHDRSLLSASRACFGSEISELANRPTSTASFVIGSASAVRSYAQHMVEGFSHPDCRATNVHEVVHNHVILAGSKNELTDLGADSVHFHISGTTSIFWNGKAEAQGTLTIDPVENIVLGKDRSPFLVLHEYTAHTDLWKRLTHRFLKSHVERAAAVDCSAFDVRDGDIRGYDLAHAEANSEKECCVACLNRGASCGGFSYSDGRKHCWLKTVGGTVVAGHSDMVSGTKK